MALIQFARCCACDSMDDQCVHSAEWPPQPPHRPKLTSHISIISAVLQLVLMSALNVSHEVPRIVAGLPKGWIIFLALCSTAISLCTVVGNLMVLVAFFIESNIRVASNYFIASLAVTDVIIGTFSMNFFTVYLLSGEWPLGVVFCRMWLFLDYTACLTSQYTVFFITVDRFCSVKIPAQYRSWRSPQRIIGIVAATWIIPAVLFLLVIVAWPLLKGAPWTTAQTTEEPVECYAEFTTDVVFNTVFTLCYFWLTLVVMCGLYAGIYQVAWRLHRATTTKRQRTAALMAMAGHTMSQIGVGVKWPSQTDVAITNKPDEKQRRSVVNRTEPLISTKIPTLQLHSPHGNLPDAAEDERTALLSPQVNRKLLNVNDSNKSTTSVVSSVVIENKNASIEESEVVYFPGAHHNLNASPERFHKFRFVDDFRRDESCASLLNLDADQVHVLQLLPQTSSQKDQHKFFTSTIVTNPCVEYATTTFVNGPVFAPHALKHALPQHQRNHRDSSSTSQEHASSSQMAINHDDARHSSSANNNGIPIFMKFTQRVLHPNFHKHTNNTATKNPTSTRSENRAWKALRTISIILGAFVACWTPFHVIVLVKGFCDIPELHYSCVNPHLYNLSYWLCYINSIVNPFCYALANAQFKNSFLRILKGDWRMR